MASIVIARQGALAKKLQIRGARRRPPTLLSMPIATTSSWREILDEADAIEREEDERYGEASR
jgi:hypothetical protein